MLLQTQMPARFRPISVARRAPQLIREHKREAVKQVGGPVVERMQGMDPDQLPITDGSEPFFRRNEFTYFVRFL